MRSIEKPLTKLQRKLNWLEPYFFLLVATLHLLPFLLFKFFPSMDGPAHLHNANLIKHLLLDSSSGLSDYYVFNQFPVPNWTGHIILAFFNLFLPGFLAEKMLVIGYVLGFAYAFRYLVKLINARNVLLSYFAFPLMYSYVFFLGFYNFSIALIFMMVTLAYWINNANNFKSLKTVFCLFGLLVLTYFSHVVVFGILVLFLFLRVVFSVIDGIWGRGYSFKYMVREKFAQITGLLIASILPLVLLFYYFYSRHSFSSYEYIDKSELFNWLYHIKPIITFHFQNERFYTIVLFYLIIFLLIVGISQWLKFKIKEEEKVVGVKRKKSNFSGFWLTIFLILFCLYLVLPNSDGTAGYMSVRLCHLLYIFLIFWLTSLNLRLWSQILALGVILVVNFNSNAYYFNALKDLNEQAVSAHNAAQHIEPHSLVLPVMKGGNWMAGHYSNYLGIEKPLVILENYECSTGYFPLIWNEEDLPNALFGEKTPDAFPCLHWRTNQGNKPEKIDYVFILGELNVDKDSCHRTIDQNLSQHYSVIFRDENCKLYALKEGEEQN